MADLAFKAIDDIRKGRMIHSIHQQFPSWPMTAIVFDILEGMRADGIKALEELLGPITEEDRSRIARYEKQRRDGLPIRHVNKNDGSA